MMPRAQEAIVHIINMIESFDELTLFIHLLIRLVLEQSPSQDYILVPAVRGSHILNPSPHNTHSNTSNDVHLIAPDDEYRCMIQQEMEERILTTPELCCLRKRPRYLIIYLINKKHVASDRSSCG